MTKARKPQHKEGLQMEYRVGYGKPPRHSQFRKGVSGNPRGRPKPRLTIRDALIENLIKRVTVQENGRTVKMPILKLIIAQAMNKAAKGDLRSLYDVIRLYQALPSELYVDGLDTEAEKQRRVEEVRHQVERLFADTYEEVTGRKPEEAQDRESALPGRKK